MTVLAPDLARHGEEFVMSEAVATVQGVGGDEIVYIVGELDARDLVFHAGRPAAREGEHYVRRARCGSTILDARLWGSVVRNRRSQRVLRVHAEKIAKPCKRCFPAS